MRVDDLCLELGRMYPKAFSTPEGFDAWAYHYRAALGEFEGPRLRRAFDDCMAAWSGFTAPKPADIRARLNFEGTNGSTSGTNMRAHYARSVEDAHWLEREWWRVESELVSEFLARFDEADVDAARAQLRHHVRALAWHEAQRRSLGRAGLALTVDARDLDRLQGRVESQRRAVGFGNLRHDAEQIANLRRQAEFIERGEDRRVP